MMCQKYPGDLLICYTFPSPPHCMRADPRDERLFARREWTAPGVVPRLLSGTDGFVAHVCFPGPWPNCRCVRAKRYVDMSRKQEDKHFCQRWKSWWPTFLCTRRRGSLSSYKRQQNPWTSDRRACGEGSRRWGTWRCVSLQLLSSLVLTSLCSRPDRDFAIPASFTHSFFTVQDNFVLSAPFHKVVNVCLHPIYFPCQRAESPHHVLPGWMRISLFAVDSYFVPWLTRDLWHFSRSPSPISASTPTSAKNLSCLFGWW